MTDAPPKFTIVTTSFNSSKTTRETLESVVQQDLKDWDRWVIDVLGAWVTFVKMSLAMAIEIQGSGS
jgi:hypothetical protein